MKKKINKNEKEGNNLNAHLLYGFIKIRVFNEYLNFFWQILAEDGFQVSASIYKFNKDFIDFDSEFREQIEQNQSYLGDSFYPRFLKIYNSDNPVDRHLCDTVGIRLDIFLEKKHLGLILPGVTINKKNQESLGEIPHFILVVREGEEEKIEKSRTRAYRQATTIKEFQTMIKEQRIQDSLNSKKFPVFKIDIENFTNQEFFNYSQKLPVS